MRRKLLIVCWVLITVVPVVLAVVVGGGLSPHPPRAQPWAP